MLSSPTGPGRGQRPEGGWIGGLWIISRVRGIGLGVNDRRRTGPDHPRLVPDTLAGLRAFHVMSRVLTSRCARSTALARTVADRAGQQIVRTVSPAHSFHPVAGCQGHRIPQNGARQDRAGQVHSRGPVPSGCAPVPVAADIGSDTAERSAWHCPPLMTRMSTGNRDPVTARRRRSRVADRVGPGADPDRVGVVPALRVGAAYADVRPNWVSVAGDRCTCTDLARPPGAAYTGVIRSQIGVGDYLYGSPRTVGDTENFEKTRPPTASRTTPAGRLGGQRRAHW